VPSGGRREHFSGISCEKSRFYAKKIIFFPILVGARRVRPLKLPCNANGLCPTLTFSNTVKMTKTMYIVGMNLCSWFGQNKQGKYVRVVFPELTHLSWTHSERMYSSGTDFCISHTFKKPIYVDPIYLIAF
jgi:hypothetical protein